MAAARIQANFRGFHARKKVKKIKKDKEVSENLGIDLKDPEVEAAATKIQAGFRGLKTRRDISQRKNPPEIVVEETSEYTEYESETSWYAEEEDEESMSLEERPLSPETSVSKFSSQSESQESGSGIVKLSGFKALACVAKLMKARKAVFEERRRSSLKDVVNMSQFHELKLANSSNNVSKEINAKESDENKKEEKVGLRA